MVEHDRVRPGAALAPFVAHFWHVAWSLRAPFLAETLPHPTVHLTFEREGRVDRAWIGGAGTARFTRRLEGEGWVFGIKFRPAAFAATGDDASTLTDARLPLARRMGRAWGELSRDVFGTGDLAARIDRAEAFLAPRLRPLSTEAAGVRDLVERIEQDRSLLRVEDAARAMGCDVRTLQRLFRRHVGVAPKWVIQRYRLVEAAERLRACGAASLASLAASLGYADQAHFARDFKRVIGTPPRGFLATHARARQASRRPG